MPKFNYTVLNNENRQLTGSIGAEDEVAARKELNVLGFSILSITKSTESEFVATPTSAQEEEAETGPAAAVFKFEFSALDKNNKKVAGTIQGEDLYMVYKRLIEEYQFQVNALYLADLSSDDKEQALKKGVAALSDRYQEENFAKENQAKEKILSEQEFAEKQAALKRQIDFVLAKVNQMLDTYKEEFDPQTKNKIKYYVEKILRIKNSTNLDYIRHTTEEMLDYIQKAELFLHNELRRKEKSQMAVEAKSMMMDLHSVNAKGQTDLSASMRQWRQSHIIDNQSPTPLELTINLFFSIFIGAQPDSPEIVESRSHLVRLNKQIKDFFIIYLQSPNKEFKQETMANIKRLLHIRKEEKQTLKKLIREQKHRLLSSSEKTASEKFLSEIFKLAGWIFCFYLIYYYLAIYASTKQLNLPLIDNFQSVFQTSVIKYFFILLFLFIAFLGIKLEFFSRKKHANPALSFSFLICSILVILNF